MSLLTMCNALALNVGLPQTDIVVGSGRREWAEAQELLDEVGDELARRVDWGDLTRTTNITGTQPVNMPSDFARLSSGICAVNGAGKAVRPLTRAEWGYLHPASGLPRYFLLTGDQIEFWPYLDAGVVEVFYQTDIWRESGLRQWQTDGDRAILDENLLTLGLIARWRRQKGMPFEDQEAEYEAAVQAHARADDRSRL